MNRPAPIAPRFFNSHAAAVTLLRSVYEFGKDQCVLDTEDGVLLSVKTDNHKGLQLQVHEVWDGKFVIVKSQYRDVNGIGWVQEVITPSPVPDRLGESVPSPFAGPTPYGKVTREYAEQHNDDADATHCMVREFFVDRGSRICHEQDGESEQTVFFDECGLRFDDLIDEGFREDELAAEDDRMERLAGEAEAWQYR